MSPITDLLDIHQSMFAKPTTMNAKAEIKIATKQIVDWLLSLNTDNRPLRHGYIQTLRHDIKAGNWCITNQGVGVSDEGVLIDGQHRLEALKAAGYPPVPLLIVTGLPREARMAVDQHAKRSARDLLQFAFNAKVSRCAPAIARVLHKVKIGWQGGGVTIHDLMDMVVEHQEQIDAVCTLKCITWFSAGVLSGAVSEMKETGRNEQIMSFLERVERGELLVRGMPEFALRSLLMEGSAGGDGKAKEFYLKTRKAISAYLSGKEVKSLRVDY